jgi:hypothetical protein
MLAQHWLFLLVTLFLLNSHTFNMDFWQKLFRRQGNRKTRGKGMEKSLTVCFTGEMIAQPYLGTEDMNVGSRVHI